MLTGLRGFAALMVLLIHSADRTYYPGLGIQSYGPVSLFVLSGFLLDHPGPSWAISPRRRSRRCARSPADASTASTRRTWSRCSRSRCSTRPRSPTAGTAGSGRITLTGIYATDGLRPALEQTWSLGTEVSWYVALPIMGVAVGLLARRMPARAPGSGW